MRLKNSILIILSFVIGLSSCLSKRVPKKINKASKKLEKHLDVVDDIVDKYPSLMDSLTVEVHDTIVLDSHTVDTSFIHVKDTAFIDKVLHEFLSDNDTVTEEKIRYIRNTIIKEVLKDTTYTYSDSLVDIKLSLVDGVYVLKHNLKEREVPYVKTQTTVKPKVIHRETPIWKNLWFWLFILLLIITSYFRVRQSN